VIRRSYLFVPGHRPDVIAKALGAGADAVILDLEDAVPAAAKDDAREIVRSIVLASAALVRINPVGTAECAPDLDAIAEHALAVRIPKCERPEDVAWVAERAPGLPLICAIETARGVLAAAEIAAVAGVANLSIGGVDLRKDLRAGSGNEPLSHVRSHLVVVSRAHDLDPPIDSVYPGLNDERGLRAEASYSRGLGFFGKSVIHPRQLAAVHEVFTPTGAEVDEARQVLAAFEAADGAATQTTAGEFVDAPVAARARELLALAGALAQN
jgi:citrate lyase subunit beta/citryl-CoA lyase